MTLDGKTIYFLGKLAASNRKEAAEAVRRAGGKVARQLTPAVGIVVVGEGDILSQDWNLWNDQLDDATREAFEAGRLEILAEAFFWERLGVDLRESSEGATEKDESPLSAPLYTPSMLAELTGVSVSLIRRLQKQRLLAPIRQIHRLCYFNAGSILPLKIVRSMLDAGLSLSKTIDRLRRVERHWPAGSLDVRIRGKNILFQTEQGPVDQDGQRRFDFIFDSEFATAFDPPESKDENVAAREVDPLEILQSVFDPGVELHHDPVSLCEAAWSLESDGNLEGAVDLYRAALAAGGPNPLINFQIAELLYRSGDLTAARERYFTAVELDEEFVEARANLGCVLVELGNDELAAAAFRGALRHHPEYAEVHFHLGMLLRRAGLDDEARDHFQMFLELAPDSPWAQRIGEPPSLMD